MTNYSQGFYKIVGITSSNERVCCTGSQLLEILLVIEKKTKNCDWYIADIDMSTIHDLPLPSIPDGKPLYLGNITKLKNMCKSVNQFYSGIFFAIPKGMEADSSRCFDTEEPPTSNLGNAILELRAFDTSYFDVYCSQLDIIQLLHKYFIIKELKFGSAAL